MMNPAKQTIGVCYYPEHWPESRWEEDARLMVAAGITHVRIGEFAWSKLEPNPCAYNFDWLDKSFDVLHRHGLKVVLGTPTATPPKWLVDRMPDMLAVDADGQIRGFGSRRHYCFSHEEYRKECARITTEFAKRYGKHPALIAWQTDNEYGCHDTVLSYSDAALNGFRNWLAQKYQSPDAMNRAWGNIFWSMEYRSFDEVELPNLTVTEPNPAHVMDFRRYSSDQVKSFNRLQTDIIRKHSNAPIGHNFMGSYTDFDHYAVSEDLDIATWDSYPIGFLDRDSSDDENKARYLGVGDPDLQAFHHDLYRACGEVRNGAVDGRWWVMEQQPGPVNWAPYNPAPFPGAVELWAWEAFAAGAELVSHFRWRQPSFAQEQMHEALLLPNGEFNEGYHVCEKVSKLLKQMDSKAQVVRADVALVFDYESQWAWEIQPQGKDFSYIELVMRYYRALRRQGINVDVIPPTKEAVTGRKLIAMPGMFNVSEDFAAALESSKAVILAGPRSGSKDENFQIVQDLPPGALRKLINIKITRVESRPPHSPVLLQDDLAFEGWREFVVPEAGVSASMKSEDGHDAIFENDRMIYLAGRPNAPLADYIVTAALDKAGVAATRLHRDIRMRDNNNVRYIFNYGPETVNCSELIGDAQLVFGAASLAPRSVTAYKL
ncbi:beta-galactosidase [Ahrensia sp. 13_GOM-1096m]|uniref:beta-galactosidase n=1 Tax=Ahrensia sp. 13_GOM-1096m TaxID=1380380 RepID=UPI00047B4959|nr:beta-galactosidase [Ahrensia sp. 13_GOM-1096m]